MVYAEKERIKVALDKVRAGVRKGDEKMPKVKIDTKDGVKRIGVCVEEKGVR